MKPVSAELLALLTSPRLALEQADLYTFSGGNLGANVLRYSSGDADVKVDGNLYSAGGATGPDFGRKDNKAKMHWKVGTGVDQVFFDVVLGSAQLFGASWQQAIRAGTFDGASFTLERAFMPSHGDTTRGVVRLFVGPVGAIDCGGGIATFTINSFLSKLTYPLPRNLYQPGCVNNLGDTACGVNLAPLARAGTAASGSTTNAVLTASLPAGEVSSGAFSLGKIVFTSGALAGLSRTILGVTAGTPATVYVLGWFPSAPAAGDTFDAYWGCDKSDGSNGCAKFANTARFKGFPNVPQPTVAI